MTTNSITSSQRKQVVLLVLIGTIALSRAQEIYGYGFLAIPIDNTDTTYALSWARVGVKGSLAQRDHLQIDQYTYKFEGDVSTMSLKYAHINRECVFDRFTMIFTAGKFLAPVSYLYNGPKTQRHLKWAETFTNYSVYGTGLMISLTLRYYPVTLRLANYGQKVWSFSADNKYLKVFWEQDVGYGGIVSSGGYLAEYFGLWSAGYSQYDNDDYSYFVKNELSLSSDWMLIFLWDDYTELNIESSLLSASISYEFMKNSFVKFGWREDQILSLNIMFSTDTWK